jgi:hypothetical protein
MTAGRIMGLTTFIRISRRFWLIILLPALIAGGLSLWLDSQRPLRYQASARLLVTYSSAVTADSIESWQITEFIIDDMPQVISSASFAAQVVPLLAERGITLSLPEIQQGLRMNPLHRAVDLSGEASSPAAAQALVDAAITVLQTNGLSFWGRTDGKLHVVVLDGVGAAHPTTSLRTMLSDAALRAALGLIVGFALAVIAARLRPTGEEGLWKSATM